VEESVGVAMAAALNISAIMWPGVSNINVGGNGLANQYRRNQLLAAWRRLATAQWRKSAALRRLAASMWHRKRRRRISQPLMKLGFSWRCRRRRRRIGEQAICSTGEAGGVWHRRRSSEMYQAAASAQLIAADEARNIRLKSIKLCKSVNGGWRNK
jgi:hypothetical protein